MIPLHLKQQRCASQLVSNMELKPIQQNRRPFVNLTNVLDNTFVLRFLFKSEPTMSTALNKSQECFYLLNLNRWKYRDLWQRGKEFLRAQIMQDKLWCHARDIAKQCKLNCFKCTRPHKLQTQSSAVLTINNCFVCSDHRWTHINTPDCNGINNILLSVVVVGFNYYYKERFVQLDYNSNIGSCRHLSMHWPSVTSFKWVEKDKLVSHFVWNKHVDFNHGAYACVNIWR